MYFYSSVFGLFCLALIILSFSAGGRLVSCFLTCFFLEELHHYVEEYVSVYDVNDVEEWRLVINEVTAFMEVSRPLEACR